MPQISLAERRALVQTAGITLDGRPASIGGARNDFASVSTTDGGPLVDVEFAWATVARVVDAGGDFRS
ncbi:Uncharacterised protein (plasmid) [Tsukamurella tyrosinosolvens]|uniref:Uncharacterized protein n=1 Tax=Tsukamurella tyrosinosolvens TaxID=57704 RepID=A0A1H4U7F3_TSUTY|nr:hypothetical protein [Tsukamurella tyrosinosolvens]KXO93005.1 hypothetical protein AXK58_14135 [Tsukamurella tyrosinosolvens]SEC64659.1 hypothetical protein SAMN04489793_2804 [Tsukamurella tyrosinosolvens]VEH94036.1 Uncharacterised protein [Tsukamurella tyrosinosolvens]